MRLPGATSHLGFDDASPGALRSVFGEAIGLLKRDAIDYAVIGGLASAALGRPRCSADIDLFVRPGDAHRAIAALGAHGFATEETNPHWLFKATRSGVLVDVIFKGPRDIYLDDEMLERAPVRCVLGQRARVAPAEDLVVMKAVVHDEETPRHWHDALGLIATADLDWDYLVRRARKGSRRVLALLFYALSVDLAVPTRALEALCARVFAGEDSGDAER